MTEEWAREILEVGPNATPGEIDSAYLKLMKRFHPDHGGSIYSEVAECGEGPVAGGIVPLPFLLWALATA